MRAFFFSLVLAAVAFAAASNEAAAAASSTVTAGGQSVQTFAGKGRAVLMRRGSILAVVRAGRIRVTDLPGGRRPSRSCNRRGRRVGPSTVMYRGLDVRCRVWGVGPWRVTFVGRGISVSGIVRGRLILDGVDSGRTGKFKIGEGRKRPWPRLARTFWLAK